MALWLIPCMMSTQKKHFVILTRTRFGGMRQSPSGWPISRTTDRVLLLCGPVPSVPFTIPRLPISWYSPSVSFRERLSNVTTWLGPDSNPRWAFATLYWEEPDASGHKYGPDDKENMRRVLEEIDEHIGELVHRLKVLGLWESLNVIITSDHGMTQCFQDRVINLDGCLDPRTTLL